VVSVAKGNENASPPPRRPGPPASNREHFLREAPPAVQALLTDVVRENLPHQYQETKNWGNQKEVFRGIKLRREGLRIETKRRKKKVNHGTWHLYRMSLVDPEDHLKVRLRNIRELDEGRTGFQLIVVAKLDAFGRLSQWERGVQLISLSVDATADVELRMDCQLGMTLDPSKLPPDVILRPEVMDADLTTHSFRVHRISKAKGPLARELGHRLHDVLVRKVDEKKARIVAKINRQIAAHEDQLRLSLHDALVSKWLPSVPASKANTKGSEVSREPTATGKVNSSAPSALPAAPDPDYS
jgi:hypothetical protein